MTNSRHRSENKSHYHYKVINNENNEPEEYFKTLNSIKDKYGISRSNIYLMCKYPDTERRKYNHLKIEKIHIHYLVIEQGLDPSTIH
jgi:hypothetical protein